MKHTDRNKRLYWTVPLILLGIYLFLVLALTLPYNRIMANAVLSDTLLPQGLLTCIDLLEIAAYALIAAWILYAAYRPCTPSVLLRMILSVAAVILVRYAMAVMSACILYGFRVFRLWYFEPTLLNNIPYCIFDLLLSVLMLIVAQVGANRYYRKQAHGNAAAIALLGKQVSAVEQTAAPLSPFSKLFDRSHPVQRALLIIGCVLTGFNILSDVIFDIRFFSQAASVDAKDIVSLIGSYLYDLLFGLLFYIASVLILSRMVKPKRVKKSKDDPSASAEQS